MKVLLAEDDALTQFMMSEMLEELDCEFDIVTDGEACVAALHQTPHRYGLVLMDVHMPRQTGVEATIDIRKAETHPPRGIPIVAVTADHHWQNRARATQAGFTDVLAKPVSLTGLQLHIERARQV